jgi:ribose-phosphate pyrophosphokinase
MAEKMKVPMALIHKERQQASKVSRMLLVGNVSGKDAVIVDDMADTCGTIIEAAKTLKANGVNRIIASVIHPVFSGDALKRLENSQIDTIIHTNTLPVNFKNSRIKFIEIDISSVFAEVIIRIHRGDSISSLFE